MNHSAGEYVRADAHTNTIESVWSLFKRSIVGAYHQISKKHMPKYLDEQAWRRGIRRRISRRLAHIPCSRKPVMPHIGAW